MSLSSFFSPSCETRELHSDEVLRTRYYRNNFTQVVEAFKKLSEQMDFDVQNINREHTELYLISNGFDCIVTVSQITPIESGVDLKINVFGAIGFGKPKKRAIELYRGLDKTLQFKGVSLHP